MTELTNEQIAVLEKVKKLLALANNNDNEHQAEAASAKAMELLASYNLDMAAIGSTAKGAQGNARKDNKLKGGLYGWQRDLWHAVSELNFCMYWSIKGLSRGSTYEHRILGSEVNVVSAQIMAEYLQNTVERLTRSYVADHFPGQSIFKKEFIAYREGMAYGLTQRLNKLRQERLEEDERKKREAEAAARHPSNASSGTGLILADVIGNEKDLNNDYLMGWEPGTTAQNRRDTEARRHAAVAAANEALQAKYQARADAEGITADEAKALFEAETKAENEKWWADYMAKAAKPSKRKVREPAAPRTRKPTAREERQQMGTFWQGVDKADQVSLNQQVDHEKKGRLA